VTLFVVPPPQPQSNRQSPPQKLLLQTRLRNSPTSLILCIESYWTNFAKSGNPMRPASQPGSPGTALRSLISSSHRAELPCLNGIPLRRFATSRFVIGSRG
jgi:hypothetical protein